MKILFPTDGSTAAGKALDALIARFEWFREVPQLTLLNVHPHVPRGAARWVSKQTVTDFYAEEWATALEPARRTLEEHRIPFVVETRVGEAAQEIVTAASEGGFDCIAMATRGRTPLANLVLGSVAQRVLVMAQVPVLFLR
jgi:nucleotide-binding universal stress UspA family protein